jgi:hypothetical protein
MSPSWVAVSSAVDFMLKSWQNWWEEKQKRGWAVERCGEARDAE